MHDRIPKGEEEWSEITFTEREKEGEREKDS